MNNLLITIKLYSLTLLSTNAQQKAFPITEAFKAYTKGKNIIGDYYCLSKSENT